MKRVLFFLLLAAVSCAPKDGEYTFRILSTNDVHGRYFDAEYVNDGVRNSLMTAAWYVDSIRTAVGKENVVLLDDGDFLQGDNAAYYFNYVDSESEHLFARMTEYMKYDAVVVGNHDVETGHAVYDRLLKQLKMPLLAANAIRKDNGKSYFQEYIILRRHGLKIAVIGFTNPGIPGWLSEELWSGMEFRELIPYAQEVVDKVRAEEKPDVVVVAVHGGAGTVDYKVLENPGMALFSTLKGVDLLYCAHDHRPVVHDADSIAMINAGSHCKFLGEGIVNVTVKDGKVVAKSSDARLIPMSPEKADAQMREVFEQDFEAVKAFTLQEVGELKLPLRTADAYHGMSAYLNLLHTLSLQSTGAQISFAAPLTYNGSVEAGTLIYNDLFTIYPFENQLYVMDMTGAEIKSFLEYSYENWINTYAGPKATLLKIKTNPGSKIWSFTAPSYNFDSAGGINYVVDVTKPYGSKVTIMSMADGSQFDEAQMYAVAMTSYRANGGGALLKEGAGLDADAAAARITARYPEIREILYDFILEHKTIDEELISRNHLIGNWKFIPETLAQEAMSKDMSLLFGAEQP